MAKGPTYVVKQRRRRQRKTNYKNRLNLLKSMKPRLTVRKTNKHTLAQVIIYNQDGDKIVAQAHTKDLASHGWSHAKSNIPSAYLVGMLVATRAKAVKATEVVVDLGMQSLVKGGRLYAVLKGALDGGLSFPVDESVFPSEDRLTGGHIASFNKKSAKIVSDFEKTKIKIKDDGRGKQKD